MKWPRLTLEKCREGERECVSGIELSRQNGADEMASKHIVSTFRGGPELNSSVAASRGQQNGVEISNFDCSGGIGGGERDSSGT